jgi:hypothetical protein
MAQIVKDGHTFVIIDEIQAQYNELVKLILATESMDNNEKQYWFDIIPSMKNEQIDRLFEILETERKKLEELESRYQEEIRNLNEKHLIEWQDHQTKENREKIKMAEKTEDANAKADDILDKLDSL